jgi:hypothetical protein
VPRTQSLLPGTYFCSIALQTGAEEPFEVIGLPSLFRFLVYRRLVLQKYIKPKQKDERLLFGSRIDEEGGI